MLTQSSCILVVVDVASSHFVFYSAVSYLPMPVIGGYLAFIGYFCLEAGIGLSISVAMTSLQDWVYLFNPQAILLATPALVSGLVLTWLSRNSTNDAALPLAMVAIPVFFYAIVWFSGVGLDGAREAGWVGGTSAADRKNTLFAPPSFLSY